MPKDALKYGHLWTEAIRRIALWSGCTRTRAVMSQALSCWLMENANVSKPKHWTRLPRCIWCSGDVQVVVGTNWGPIGTISKQLETTGKASKKATLGLVILRHDSSLMGLTPYVLRMWFSDRFQVCFSWKVAHHGSKLLCPEKKQQIVPECSNIPMVYSHFGPRKMTKFPLFLPWNLDENSEASCVAVYRVPSPSAGTILLNHFHQPGTISHAVLGGHGSDNAWRLGEFTTIFWGSWSQSVHRKPEGRGMFYF